MKAKVFIPVECLHFNHVRINFSLKCFELFHLLFNHLDIGSKRSYSPEFFLGFLQELK